MSHKTMLAAVALCASVLMGGELFAQGKGNGLNRALGAQARGAAGSSIGGAVSRQSGSIARGNAIGSAARTQRANSTMSRASRLPAGAERPLGNQQRILDKRFDQADHLRSVSERNGNEKLLDSADRMDASAVRNYDRQTGLTVELPPAEEGATSVPPPSRTIPADEMAVPARKASRGFWIRSR